MSIILEVENLCIHRGGVQVLDLPRFSIATDEKVAVIGVQRRARSIVACVGVVGEELCLFLGKGVIERGLAF